MLRSPTPTDLSLHKTVVPDAYAALKLRIIGLVVMTMACGCAVAIPVVDVMRGTVSDLEEPRTSLLSLLALTMAFAALLYQKPLKAPVPQEKRLWLLCIATAALFPLSGPIGEWLVPWVATGKTGPNTALVLVLIATGQLLKRPAPVLATCLHGTASLPLLVAVNGFLMGIDSFHGQMSLTSVIALGGLWVAALTRFIRNRYVRSLFMRDRPSQLIRLQIAILVSMDIATSLTFRIVGAQGSDFLPVTIAIESLGAWLVVAVFSFRFVDLLEEARRNERMLLGEATSDPLTGLASRRVAMDYYLANAGRAPLAVLLVDIDHFKTVNDSYGHLVGDHALTRIADQLRANVRITDCVARWGGEEFLLMLRGAEVEDLPSLADTLRTSIARLPPPTRDARKLTVSIGASHVSARPKGTLRSFEEVLRGADDALYAAKQAGRDCMRVDTALLQDITAEDTNVSRFKPLAWAAGRSLPQTAALTRPLSEPADAAVPADAADDRPSSRRRQ